MTHKPPREAAPGFKQTQISPRPSLNELWNSAPPSGQVFDHAQLSSFPEAARRYLEHAIAPGTPLASAARLRIHGEIKLRGWLPFTAEQVIVWGLRIVWQAAVRMSGMTIRGFDRLVDGDGAMRWKVFGIIPVSRSEKDARWLRFRQANPAGHGQEPLFSLDSQNGADVPVKFQSSLLVALGWDEFSPG